MIVSASRRTDIPAFHFPWLLERLHEGFTETVNPFNPRMKRRVSLRPGDADIIVFWTKDARPMEALLPRFQAFGIPFLLLYTITPYGEDLEPGVRDKEEILHSFLRLSDLFGPDRMVWRFDPIVLSRRYPADFHLSAFRRLAKSLEGRTDRCITSFVHPYRRVRRALEDLGLQAPPPETRRDLLDRLAGEAAGRGILLTTCADGTPPGPAGAAGLPGAGPGACIDGERIRRILGRDLRTPRDPHQRPDCLCARSVDIGAYSTCGHRCVYCYAGSAGAPPPGNRRSDAPRGGTDGDSGRHPDGTPQPGP